ncbi:hypothetical protein TNCV_4354551 [Trichonephila clavipes]|nr:hypothetical protein TNCV_4354551 [Trichonephila clavipes]
MFWGQIFAFFVSGVTPEVLGHDHEFVECVVSVKLRSGIAKDLPCGKRRIVEAHTCIPHHGNETTVHQPLCTADLQWHQVLIYDYNVDHEFTTLITGLLRSQRSRYTLNMSRLKRAPVVVVAKLGMESASPGVALDHGSKGPSPKALK